jgi:hypothetical protein
MLCELRHFMVTWVNSGRMVGYVVYAASQVYTVGHCASGSQSDHHALEYRVVGPKVHFA